MRKYTGEHGGQLDWHNMTGANGYSFDASTGDLRASIGTSGWNRKVWRARVNRVLEHNLKTGLASKLDHLMSESFESEVEAFTAVESFVLKELAARRTTPEGRTPQGFGDCSPSHV